MGMVDIVAEEVGSFAPLPLPYRRVDVNAAPARHLARACAVRSTDVIGKRLALAHRAPRLSLKRPGCRGDGRAGPAGTYHTGQLSHAARLGTFPPAPR